MVFVVYRRGINEKAMRVFAVYDNFAAASKHKSALMQAGEDQLDIETLGLNVQKEYVE